MRDAYRDRSLRDSKGRVVGSWHAVAYGSKEGVDDWLAEYGAGHVLRRAVRRLRGRVGVLQLIRVKAARRGEGYGDRGLARFMRFCQEQGCRHAILIADLTGPQKAGFDLIRWYKNRGFRKIGRVWRGLGAVMLAKVPDA